MTIMELGALGEFVGAIAVVVTLFYLAVQIRASRKATEVSTSQELLNQLNSINAIWLNNPEGQAAFRKLCRGDDMDADLARIGQTALRYMANTYFQAYVLHQRGSLAPEMWANVHYNTIRLLSTPGGKEWFKTRTNDFPEGFREFVLEEMVEVGDYAVPEGGPS